MPEILSVAGVHKHYDGVQALRGASFSLAAGEVHALMGENGAGKSTLAKILAGSVRADAGQILLDGKQVEIRNPLDAQRLGIGMIYQELDLFPHLSIAENIAIGRAVRFRDLHRFAQPFLDRVGLAASPRTMLGSLRAGEMQLVAIARALSSNARILLMDEPTSSLFDDAVERLFRLIADLKQRGVAIVYVSHRMDEIFRICDRATVLRDGETVGTCILSETAPGELIRMMVGRDLESTSRSESVYGAPLLSVSNLSTKKLQNISFELRKGEVLGIAGLVGAGRSEIGAALFGLDHRLSGTIRLHGREIHPRSPAEAIKLGIALLPEDRKREGLMMRMSVAENASLGRFSKLGFINAAAESSALAPVFRTLSLRNAPRVSALSGGNQQKVLLARCLLANPEILFLDDPTRGIDIGAKQEIYAMIEKLKSEGKGIILVSSELPELLRCSDRILVMREGRATATFDSSEATPGTYHEGCDSMKRILVGALLLSACSTPKKEFFVAFSQCNNAEPYRAAQNALMTKLFAEAGGVKLVIADAQQDNSKQVAQVETFIRQKPDLLIVAPNERAALTAVMGQAMEAHIPVICLERDILLPNYTTYIHSDNTAIGRLAGQFIVDYLTKKYGTPKGNVVQMRGLLGVEGEIKRDSGAKEILAKYPEIHIVAEPVADWIQAKAKDRMTEVLRAQASIDVVYGHNDPMAVGAYLAAKELGREKQIAFIGVDGLDGDAGGVKKVADGILAATFVYPLCVDKAVEVGLKMLRDPSFKPEKDYNLPSTIVTK